MWANSCLKKPAIDINNVERLKFAVYIKEEEILSSLKIAMEQNHAEKPRHDVPL